MGYLTHTGGMLTPDISARDAVTTLYGMLFRILGYDLVKLMAMKDPSLHDLMHSKGL